jgi:hypothetical protein
MFCPPEHREDEFFNLITSYENRSCQVEPWSYTMELSRVKKSLFAFLDRSHTRPDASSATAA